MRFILSLFLCLFLPSPVLAQNHIVERVVDGDTLKLSNKERVRLIGVDTPESSRNQKAKKDSQRSRADLDTIVHMGKEAKAFMQELLQGKEVIIEYDVEKRDRYGRLLAYVYLPVCQWMDGQAPCLIESVQGFEYRRFRNVQSKVNRIDVFVNATVIKSGYAQPMTIPPNVKYSELFSSLYAKARNQKIGLWSQEIMKNLESDQTAAW